MKKTAEEFKQKEPPFASYDSSGKRISPPEFDLSLFGKQRNPEKQENMEEKAPITESGSSGDKWSEIGSNLQVKYEVPSFDRAGGINVLVNGKMPNTLGHFVQFNGILESAGIGDIFTMDHELISSLRKFVYQEMPRVDKFSKDILDDIYSDAVAEIGMNVPIKSIYEYLRNNYPKEFSKATKGSNVTTEQLSEVIKKQREFYGKRTLANNGGVLKTAADQNKSKGIEQLYKIDIDKLNRINPKAVEEIKKNPAVNNLYIIVKDKDNGQVLIAGRNQQGSNVGYIIPRIALIQYDGQETMAEMYKKLMSEDKKNKKEPQIGAKFFQNQTMNDKEIQELFLKDVFSTIDSQDNFDKILSAHPNKDQIIEAYKKLKGNLQESSRKKFINFKTSQGQSLENDESSELIKHFEGMNYERFKSEVDKIQDKKSLFDAIAQNENALDKNLVMNSIRYKVAVNPKYLNDTDKTLLLKNYDAEKIEKENPALLPIIIKHKKDNTSDPLNDFEINYAVNNHQGSIGDVVKNRNGQFLEFYHEFVDNNKLQELPYDFKKFMMLETAKAIKDGQGGTFTPQEKNDQAYKDIFNQQSQQSQQPQQNVASRISNREIKISKREK